MDNEKEYLIPTDSELFKRFQEKEAFAREKKQHANTDLEINYWRGYITALKDTINLEKENENAG